MNNLARDVEHLMRDGFEGGAVIRDRQDEFFEPRHQIEGELPNQEIRWGLNWRGMDACALVPRNRSGGVERGLDFLATTQQDVPERHRSLCAVFDHSWKLLSDEERRVLCRVAVFRGGFRREAAEQVRGVGVIVFILYAVVLQ